MSNPDFPTPNPVIVLFLTTITGFIGLLVFAPVVIINLFGIIIAAATCICVIGGAVLIMRKLPESN